MPALFTAFILLKHLIDFVQWAGWGPGEELFLFEESIFIFATQYPDFVLIHARTLFCLDHSCGSCIQLWIYFPLIEQLLSAGAVLWPAVLASCFDNHNIILFMMQLFLQCNPFCITKMYSTLNYGINCMFVDPKRAGFCYLLFIP